ncbi:hypothetical protein GCK72_010807 [Caenorhabditis remanei]|uniref:Uncharacterized protein n=1 Tax=Caenorhabditis remanei TaxID=31234 RepID=A0A6A5H639_CAERE|nr:hypothetical protein GCK72_010807 [Caenorhabditis remanei]KAF1762545.1 hypothetical protein GCK72_010807 [Caenorhabditis remanei]
MRVAFILLILIGLGCCCSIFPLTSGCWKLPESIISTALNSTIPLVQKTAKADLCAVEHVLKSTPTIVEVISRMVQDTSNNVISTVHQLIRNIDDTDLVKAIVHAVNSFASQSLHETDATVLELIRVVSKLFEDVEENCYEGLNPAAFHIEGAWNVIEELKKTVGSQANM